MRSLWIDADARRYPALDRDAEVDIAIVGAGLSGLGAAYALRAGGRSVALLEERVIGGGASGRNAGFLLQGPAMPFVQAVDALGESAATEIWRFTEENNRVVSGIALSVDGGCGYLRRGSMSLAATQSELKDLARSHAGLASIGVSTCLVAQAQLPVPFDAIYSGGLYYPGNGEIDPGRFLAGVAALVAPGLSIFEATPVLAMDRSGTWKLTTPAGVVRAEQVILATNAYTSRLLPEAPIAPKRGQVLATGPLDRTVVPFPMYANQGFQYWRQTPEGRLVVGGWRDQDLEGEVGHGETLHAAIQSTLDRFCVRILGDAPPVEHRWCGIMGFTPDHLPLVGPVPGHDDLWIVAGYSGHGVCMAFLCGAAVANGATGAALNVPTPFHPGRFGEALDG